MDLNNNQLEVLKALRELTKLGPIEKIKIKRACRLAEKEAIKDVEYPVGHIDVDYTIANNLELRYRMVALANALTPLWQKFVSIGEYRSGLSDYVRDYLSDYIDKMTKESSTKTLKK